MTLSRFSARRTDSSPDSRCCRKAVIRFEFSKALEEMDALIGALQEARASLKKRRISPESGKRWHGAPAKSQATWKCFGADSGKLRVVDRTSGTGNIPGSLSGRCLRTAEGKPVRPRSRLHPDVGYLDRCRFVRVLPRIESA